ncbi:MAG: SLC13 family permease [Verrucomicrobia bacterium]|nr:SLC13 family permease [Verrucomicrobiota bacterium]
MFLTMAETSVVLWWSLSWQGWITVGIFFAILALLIQEIFPPAIPILGGASLLLVCGAITPKEFLSGFASPVVFSLGMLCVVVKALHTVGLVDLLARRILPKTGSYRYRLMALMAPASFLAAFLHATPIVLMLTGIVRKWAVAIRESPSKYLMPLSMATICGGMCTLIGTSTNLVVDGLLKQLNPNLGIAFFELGMVAFPGLLLTYSYVFSWGHQILPTRRDPRDIVQEETREFISEFTVEEGCPLIKMSTEAALLRYFPEGNILQIERNGHLEDSPPLDFQIALGDRLVISGEMAQIARLHTIAGLSSVADPSFKIDVNAPHFAEVVVGINSYLINRSLRHIRFRTRYNASVVAIYREGARIKGSIRDIILKAGDTLMLLSNVPWPADRHRRVGLYPITYSQELPFFSLKKAIWVAFVLLGMVAAITIGIPLLIASLVAAALLLMTRMLTLRQAAAGIDWNLLLLVASAFALAQGLYTTGVATALAKGVMFALGTNHYLLIGGIFLLTMMVTEMITNTASALLVFPIAIETIRLAGYDSPLAFKAVAVTVALAASCSFLTPIGHQTNTIVYGPGGYRFGDYARFGAIPSVVQLLISTALIPLVWPFYN